MRQVTGVRCRGRRADVIFAAEFDSRVPDLAMDEGLDIFDGCC
jgi:hypothetical protein